MHGLWNGQVEQSANGGRDLELGEHLAGMPFTRHAGSDQEQRHLTHLWGCPAVDAIRVDAVIASDQDRVAYLSKRLWDQVRKDQILKSGLGAVLA